jgi:predicted anti-sigma-YlaC factor YlaD
MKCEEFRALVQSGLDAKEETAVSREGRAHTDTCPTCKKYYESMLALHGAMYSLPRVSPTPDFVASLNHIEQIEYVPAKLSWRPEIRLAAALLSPLVLPYIAQQYSLDQIQYILEALIMLLGLTAFGIAALKPFFLGGHAYHLAPDRR